jgi:hypothetical protein
MVVLHYKKNDLNQFLLETSMSIPIDELLNLLVLGIYILHSNLINLIFFIVNNLRLKLDRAAISLEDLASKGPMKPEELRGLKDYEEYVKNDD